MRGLFMGPGPAQSSYLSKQNLHPQAWSPPQTLLQSLCLLNVFFFFFFNLMEGIIHLWRLLLIRLLSYTFDFESGYHKIWHSLHWTEICLFIPLTPLSYFCLIKMSKVTLIPFQITHTKSIQRQLPSDFSFLAPRFLRFFSRYNAFKSFHYLTYFSAILGFVSIPRMLWYQKK